MRIAAVAALLGLVLGGAAMTIGMLSPTRANAQAAGGFEFSRPEVVATGLAVPWGMAFLPDGSALVAERVSAQIRQLRPGSPPQAMGTVPDVDAAGEGGLLGLAVSPDFDQDGWVYAYHTSPTDNRVVRFPLESPQDAEEVITGIPRGAIVHDGGRLQFGPDGMLYASTGDASTPGNAQDLDSLGGKILRTTPAGDVPPDNPFPGSPVFSLGHRNVQGLAWDDQGRLWASELGENLWDEVNRIVPGGNYGWPACEGVCDPPEPDFVDPVLVWTTAEASPSGVAVANNHLFVAALRGQRLWVVPLSGGGTGVGNPTPELSGAFGRLRTVEVGPDGWLWVSTSNQDGRGVPGPDDDRVVRFPPVDALPPSEPPPTDPPATEPPATEPPATQPPSTQPPPTQPPPTGPPPTTPPPAGACTATYQFVNQWPGGFQAEVTVSNNGGSTSSGWVVAWTFTDGQSITQAWSGIPSQVGGGVWTVSNESWNGTLAPWPAGSTAFGFLGTWNGLTNGAPLTSCTLR
jgi:glucose/arabinose dehydrogenase